MALYSKDICMNTIKAVSIAQKLRDFIIKKNLRPGDRLPTHVELRQKLKIGSRKLREALSILNQQGIIETRRRGGTIVKEPSVEILGEPIAWQLEHDGYTLTEMVKARAVMESAIVAEAARSRKSRDLLVMYDAIEKMQAQTEPNQQAEDADEIFHMAILAATHNPVMKVFGQLIVGQFKQKPKESVFDSPEELLKSTKEHEALYHCIENRRPEAARKKMYEHIMDLSQKTGE